MRLVLGTFHRPHDRVIAPRDQKDRPLFRPVECGSQFDTVLNTDASRCSGARIDQTAVIRKADGRIRGRIRNRRLGLPHGLYCVYLIVMQRDQRIQRGPDLKITIPAVDIFRRHNAKPGKSPSSRQP